VKPKPSGQERERDTEADVRLAAPGERAPASAGSSLLEREDELQRIAAAIALARAGTGAVVALEGPAGIGKTRLLRAAVELAAESDVAVISPPRGSSAAAAIVTVNRSVAAIAALPRCTGSTG
jgi:MoxR-like ATPase